jgi:hypothetical protein
MSRVDCFPSRTVRGFGPLGLARFGVRSYAVRPRVLTLSLSGGISLVSQNLVRLSFGKHRGRTYEEVAMTDPAYLEWIINTWSFSPATRQRAMDALSDSSFKPATCKHRDRTHYAKGLCWPCYAAGWNPRTAEAKVEKAGAWATYRKELRRQGLSNTGKVKRKSGRAS